MNNSTKFCLYCGNPLPSDALFCSACGRQQSPTTSEAPTFSAAPPYHPSSRPKKKIKALPVVKAFLLLFISIALLALSFVPIVSSEINIHENNTVSVKLSAAEITRLFFDSFESRPEEDVEEELNDLSLDIQKKAIEALQNKDLTDKDLIIPESLKNDISDMVKELLHLGYQHEDTTAPAVMWAAVIVYFLYIAVCSAAIVVSIIYLVFAFALPSRCESLYKVSVTLFCAIPALLTSLLFAMPASMENSLGVIVTNEKLPIGFFVAIMISLLAVICFAVMNLIVSRKTRKTRALPRIIAAIACILISLSVFLPVMSSSVRLSLAGNRSDDKDTFVFSHGADFFTHLHIGEDDKELLEEFAKSSENRKEGLNTLYENMEFITEDEAEQGKLRPEALEYLLRVSAVYKLYNSYWLFALTPLIYLLVLLSAGVILWLNLSDITGGIYSSVTSLVFKILSAVLALCALGLILTFILLEQFYIKEMDLSRRLACGISYGIITTVSLAVANAFVPARRFFKKERRAANASDDTQSPETLPEVETIAPETIAPDVENIPASEE